MPLQLGPSLRMLFQPGLFQLMLFLPGPCLRMPFLPGLSQLKLFQLGPSQPMRLLLGPLLRRLLLLGLFEFHPSRPSRGRPVLDQLFQLERFLLFN